MCTIYPVLSCKLATNFFEFFDLYASGKNGKSL